MFLFVSIMAASAVAETISNIQSMSNWESCSVCAGQDGHGVDSPHSMTQFVSSPSMDGQSAQFWLGGTHPYGDALWWKQLGGQSGARHFVYDLYFYLKNAQAPQALEFDVNQSVGGQKYIFGTECDIKDHRQWRVWGNGTWQDTGIGCSAPTTYTWHHLVEEFYRTPDGKVNFVSITLDGNRHYVNRTYAPRSGGGSEMNVAFQMDGNSYQTDYSVWLDKVTLNYW